MSTSTATAYKNSVAGHLSFGVPKCEKAQKSSGFWANCTYRLCIKDNVLIDPCMGSGHILVYAFDVLMEIYRECGYSDRDAALNIVQHNLYGMDIDKRAYQLAYFAVMMKARSYNRRALTQCILNNLAVCEESNAIDRFACDGITNDKEQNKIGEYLIEAFKNAQELGTLQTVKQADYKSFAEYLLSIQDKVELPDIFAMSWYNDVLPKMLQFTKQAQIMSKKYAVVCTNPPYMGKLEGKLKEFVIDNYKPYFGDLFSVFMYRNFGYCKADGYSAFMTPNVWLSAQTYIKLREWVIENKDIVSLIQMAKGAFFKEATVDICSFIMRNSFCNENKGIYIKLDAFRGDMDIQEKYTRIILEDKESPYRYEKSIKDFSSIQNSPIAFWVTSAMYKIFEKGTIMECYGKARSGLQTSDNKRFLRLWFEVSINNIIFNCYSHEQSKVHKQKWYPHIKGGEYRKWYGNLEYILNWQYDGQELYEFARMLYGSPTRIIKNTEFYFQPCITWTHTTSKKQFAARWIEKGMIFNVEAPSLFNSTDSLYFIGLLNTKVATAVFLAKNQTIHFLAGETAQMPVYYKPNDCIAQISKECIKFSKTDWDSFETSWDFKEHPLVRLSKDLWDATAVGASMSHYYGGNPEVGSPLELCYMLWQGECNERFKQLKANEEELNRIFIDIYGLQDELTPEVEDKDVTVRKADLGRDIRSLLSYAVGCMFGRYSLDEPGLICAGGEWDGSKYSTFIPDKDNCIPITDEAYFEDDIVGQFVGWMKKAFGEENLETNLDFIAKALGNKGATSREVIRNYFLNDFMKDHIKIYQKRPIYWLFDSGKQKGFKALVYMHRWNADTVGNLRVEYLHKMQHIYEREIGRMQETIDNSRNSREISKATKRKDKLQKQLKEIKDYDAKLAHIALSRIEIDLDDGVKVNYEKVQTGRDGKKMQILAKI